MQSTRLRKCKIGNWQEEIAFELDRKAMVAKAREQAAMSISSNNRSVAGGGDDTSAAAQADGGGRAPSQFLKSTVMTAATSAAGLSAQIMAKRDHHLQPTALGDTLAGCIQFGVPIQLHNAETDGLLSIDIQAKSGHGTNLKIVATTSSAAAAKPVLRNSWYLLPVQEDIDLVRSRCAEQQAVAASAGGAAPPSSSSSAMDPSRVLHYGQRFVVCSMDDMCVPAASHSDAPGPVFLASEAKTPQSQAKRSPGQEVYFTPNASQKCWWSAVYSNAEFRPDMEFTPAKAGSFFLLRHHMTSTPLASTKTMAPNDFGAEYEVCGHRFLRIRVRNGNALETEANLWCVKTSDSA